MYHEQHCQCCWLYESFGKSMGDPQVRPPRGAKTSGGIELKIVMINLLGGSDEAGKVSNLRPFGGRLGDGVKFTLIGPFLFFFYFLKKFFTDFLLHALRSHGAPNRRA